MLNGYPVVAMIGVRHRFELISQHNKNIIHEIERLFVESGSVVNSIDH